MVSAEPAAAQIPGNFGTDFFARPNFRPKVGQWHSWEMMVKASTSGLRDGRITMWVDGNLVADWPNVCLRDVPMLKVDVIYVDLRGNAPRSVALTVGHYDNCVVATSYIGPLYGNAQNRPMPPTDERVPATTSMN